MSTALPIGALRIGQYVWVAEPVIATVLRRVDGVLISGMVVGFLGGMASVVLLGRGHSLTVGVWVILVVVCLIERFVHTLVERDGEEAS